jgi:hypothetical protein
MSEQVQAQVPETISPLRLWFGFTGGAVAWVGAGVLNVVLAWEACVSDNSGSFFFTQTGVRVVLSIVTLIMLALAIAAGVISFQNWRRLERQREFVEAEGRGRQEFMAIFGVFVSACLGIGIFWFVLPIYIIRFCVRAH